MHEKHAYRLVRDLFDHKEAIFGELKRASALSHTPSGGNASKASRIRAISTDESNRRANMEERNRAIASKSRNSSPAPQTGGPRHRRDRSSDPPTTRFPVHTSPPASANENRRGNIRASLEVPGENGEAPTPSKASQAIPENATVPSDGEVSVNGTFSDQPESVGRSSRFPPRKPGGQGSLGSNKVSGVNNPRDSVEIAGAENRGVQLSDRPMDD